MTASFSSTRTDRPCSLMRLANPRAETPPPSTTKSKRCIELSLEHFAVLGKAGAPVPHPVEASRIQLQVDQSLRQRARGEVGVLVVVRSHFHHPDAVGQPQETDEL